MSDNKYLLVWQGDELEIYQDVRIISDSDVAYNLHLMEFKHKIEEDDIMYYYTIGDRISLREMVEAKRLNKKNFFSIISYIAYAMSKAEKYELTHERFIIDSEFIYVGEVDTLLTYVPFEIQVDVKTEFRRLINFMADKLIDGGEDLKKINAIIKKDFSFEDIREYCNEIDKNLGNLENDDDEEENNNFPIEINPKEKHVKEFVWGENIPINEENDTEKSNNIKKHKEKKPKKEGFLSRISKRKELKEKPTKKTLKKPQKKTKNISKTTGKDFNSSDGLDDTFIEEEIDITMIDDDDEMTNITVFLLCNAPINEIENEKVIIKTTPFFIARRFPGGISESGLFIARKYISSRHAEIVREKNDFYIIDVGTEGKGSKGGTFINGNKLEPNVKTLLNNGDLIKFYKLEYTFHVGE